MAERPSSGLEDLFGAASLDAGLGKTLLAVDWEKTPAGEVGGWPAALRSTVRTMLYAACPMAVLIGREGIVVCNAAACGVFGDAWQTAQGRSIFEVLPIARKFYREMIDAAFRGNSHGLKDQAIRLWRNGVSETCWFNLGLSPVMGDDGEVFGTLLEASETTEHIRTRKALTLAQERVEVALEAGGIVGTWDFDVRSRKVIIDCGLAEQYGIPPELAGKGIPIEVLFENLHAEDCPRVLAAFGEAVAVGGKFHNRFRTITRDGALHWYIASGRPVRNESGAVTGFAGILIDTTTQSEVAAELRESNLRFDTLTEAIPQIVWSADRHGTHDFFNRRWTEFTGIEQESIVPTLWTELVHPDDWNRVSQTWQNCLKTGQPYDIDYRFRHHSDGFRWLRVIALPMRDADGNILRWYGTSTDIEDAKLLEAQRELVNRELDHRIGNLFTLVNGLVSLSARSHPQCTAFARDIRSRLVALNRAHELIRHRSGGEPVLLGTLLDQILAPYAKDGAAEIRTGGCSLLLRPEMVAPFALVFHELATNAAKYGALAATKGRLTVNVVFEPETVAIDWMEQGCCGLAGKGSSGGFGSTLLKTIVEGQFRGSMQREISAAGFRLRLRFPQGLFSAPGGGGRS